MNIAKLFKNGSSQAVRLPKEYNFEGTEVYVQKIGRSVVLLPKDNPWEMLISSVHDFTADYLSKRVQPPVQKRKDL
ncbi:MAG: AbrB/MazE/SpoVT family DNA-binding domain-containing protein [Deltaproteobacteria bacterium HGW-Deltaproteobacteria-6]|jgi:antitoxin VapB|nr:MAG: AbrB/MazE/SpoVT family DNA-binding domain-containing protein [Deltaproteobacteria bacterium HGW-Deltaproteobacteria-6]